MAVYLPPLFGQNILQKIVATNMWSLSNKNILTHFHQEKKKFFKSSYLLLNFSHYLYIRQWQSCSNIFFKCLLSSLFLKIRTGRTEHNFEHISGEKKYINSKNVCLRTVSSAHENEEHSYLCNIIKTKDPWQVRLRSTQRIIVFQMAG